MNRDGRTPVERLAETGAFAVDDTGAFVVDGEGNVAYDTARLLYAIQTDPALMDDMADVFGAEGAQAISAVMEKARGAEEGNWLSRWWRCTAAFASAVGFAWLVWLATDHWPVIYTARIVWRFFVKVVL